VSANDLEADAAIIRVSFDIEQISSDLVWRAAELKSNRDLFATVGRFAGAVHLRQDDAVTVQVTAYGGEDALVTINVIDAMLYTVPHTSGGVFCAPSPFSKVRATTPVGQWAPAEIHRCPERKLKLAVQTSLAPLQVVETDGRWKLSLILTVLIERYVSDKKISEIRVFSFDPEAEVGSGTEPPTQTGPSPGSRG